MPNWVTNIVNLSGDNEETIKKAINFLASEETEVDFNNIVEMPEELRHTESGSRADDAWVYYQAKALGDKKGIEARLSWPWVINEGIKTVDELLEYMQKRNPDIYKYGEKLYELHREFGCHDWYNWACRYWGTKWNACDPYVGEDNFGFNTAWSAVPQLIQKLSCLFPTLTMEYRWADENYGYNLGEFTFKNGDVIDENLPEEGSDEAYALAADILGYELDWDDEEEEEDEESEEKEE